MMRGMAFIMSTVHAVLLNFSAGFRQSLIHKGHTLVGLLAVAFEEDYNGASAVDDQECSRNVYFSEKSELGPQISLQRTISKGREGKMKAMHRVIRSI